MAPRAGQPGARSDDRRVFLGWDRSAIESAADWLAGRYLHDGELDLSRVLLIVPGARASRTLLAVLAARAREENFTLLPPTALTPGAAVDDLLGLTGRFAGGVASRLAWADALRAQNPDDIEPLVPSPPGGDDEPSWLALGDVLARVHRELAGELLLFEDIAPRAAELGAGVEQQRRWEAAARAQRAYESILDRRGSPDRDLKRVGAVCSGAAVRDADIVVLAVPDMNAMCARVVESAGDRAAVLVFAPDALADRFDRLGRIDADGWADAPIDIAEEQLLFGETPADQADLAAGAIAALDGRYAPDQIAIGAPDAEVADRLALRAARFEGFRIRDAAGKPTARTGPYRLLLAAAEYLEQRSFLALGSLVRHPDLERYICRHWSSPDPGERRETPRVRTEWWLTEMDGYRADHLHDKVTGRWHTRRSRRRAALLRIHRAVTDLLADLDPPGADRVRGVATHDRPLRAAHEWARPILGVLLRVYGDTRIDRRADAGSRAIAEACRGLRSAIDQLSRARPAPDEDPALVSPAQAIRLVLAEARDGSVPPPADDRAVEMLGWLELPLDPAPVAILTGMNEGVVPPGRGPDPMLPDAVRARLGIACDRRRVAREAWILSAILASREHVRITAAQRSADNDPLWPSRLLLRCADAALVDRLRRFTGRRRAVPPPPRAKAVVAAGSATAFDAAPLIGSRPEIDSLPVTAFRTYLRSPYLFFLRHVLRIDEADDGGPEMDPRGFGSLVHAALERFALSDERDSADPDLIEKCLADALDKRVAACFGGEPPVAVLGQAFIAHQRLAAFARIQAERAARGWRIAERPEWSPGSGAAPFVVDGKPINLRGKIDRIDRNEQTGEVAILDYKTGSNARKPESAHRARDGRWRDLQLPLYRHLAAELALPAGVKLGYVWIASPEHTKFMIAEWDGDALAEADEAARGVVRAIREGRYRLGPDDELPDDGVFAALCGVGVEQLRRAGGAP